MNAITKGNGDWWRYKVIFQYGEMDIKYLIIKYCKSCLAQLELWDVLAVSSMQKAKFCLVDAICVKVVMKTLEEFMIVSYVKLIIESQELAWGWSYTKKENFNLSSLPYDFVLILRYLPTNINIWCIKVIDITNNSYQITKLSKLLLWKKSI